MPRKTFTPEQIRKLSRNKHVSRCGTNTVRYTRAFRADAMRQYEAGLSAAEIFINAGFDLSVIGKYAPNHLMCQWRTAIRTNVEKNTDPLQRPNNNLARLRAEVSYLKAANHFLAQIRARKSRSRSDPAKGTQSSKS